MMVRLLVLMSLIGFVPCAVAADDPGPPTVRLLTIGNSFAENALSFLPALSDAAGCRLIVGRANLGGCSLQRHWSLVEKHEANPEDPAGRPYFRGTRSLHDMLKADAWDYVTLQQYSFISHDPRTYQPYAGSLLAYIRQRAPQATVLFHQTWAYRADDPRFKPGGDDTQPRSQQQMYERVRAACRQIAGDLGIGVIPAGDAMFLADTNPTWGFRADPSFDPAGAQPPLLPDQSRSLHVGWVWKDRNGTPRLSMDGHHASMAGRYLIGCVWFEILFDRSVTDNSFVPNGLAADYARFLRQTAHEAVTAARQPQ